MRYPTLRCVALLVLIGAVETSSNFGIAQTIRNTGHVESARSRPDLVVQLDNVARLKIASRKASFRIGEMIDLDLALLNSSNKPLFFPRIVDPQITVRTVADEPLRVAPYGVADRTTTVSSFSLIAPNDFETGSFQLLAGCNRNAFVHLSQDNALAAFNQDLFVSWGSACLALTRPGTYVITAELNNNYVVVPRRRDSMKSAVGKIRSNPLRITIVE